jgi:hypothetical protein
MKDLVDKDISDSDLLRVVEEVEFEGNLEGVQNDVLVSSVSEDVAEGFGGAKSFRKRGFEQCNGWSEGELDERARR